MASFINFLSQCKGKIDEFLFSNQRQAKHEENVTIVFNEAYLKILSHLNLKDVAQLLKVTKPIRASILKDGISVAKMEYATRFINDAFSHFNSAEEALTKVAIDFMEMGPECLMDIKRGIQVIEGAYIFGIDHESLKPALSKTTHLIQWAKRQDHRNQHKDSIRGLEKDVSFAQESWWLEMLKNHASKIEQETIETQIQVSSEDPVEIETLAVLEIENVAIPATLSLWSGNS